MLKSLYKARMRHFIEDTRGYITVEALIVFPALLWLFGAGWVWFDVFRQQGVNQKANYTIGDMLSRETDPIDDIYVDNSLNLLQMLNKSQGTESDIRISVVRYNANNNNWKVMWSAARGDYPALANVTSGNYDQRLPVVAHNDELIIVETWDDYNPVFKAGLNAFEIKTYSFTRPRFAPHLLFADAQNGNNGWGNGDQDAPGGSLCNNNAENATDCANNDGSENIEPNKNGNGHQP